MRRLAPWVIVLLFALLYPVGAIVGGTPSFPSRDDCALPAVPGSEIDAVFGYFDSETEARGLRDRAVGAGYEGVEVRRDACGRARVFLGGVPSLEVGSRLVGEARSAGFDVVLEQAH